MARNGLWLLAFVGLSALVGCGESPSERGRHMQPLYAQQASSADYTTVVQTLYVSYYGRPADPAGLKFWADYLAQGQAPTTLNEFWAAYATNSAVKTVVDNFGRSEESVALYGTDNEIIVRAIYKNLFNRDPDSSGLSFYVDGLNRGLISAAQAALTIANGSSGSDKDSVNVKTAASIGFTASLDTEGKKRAYDGLAANDAIRIIIATARPSTNVDNTLLSAKNALNLLSSLSVSVSINLDDVTYPESYKRIAGDFKELNTNPCQLDYKYVTYPQAWIGRYPLPAINGAPLQTNFVGGMTLKDIMLPDNPTFNPDCTGSLNLEFDRTIERLRKLNVKYVKIPQWHWIQIDADGNWYVERAENSYGPLPDVNLKYFTEAAKRANIKVIMTNQIQGINDPVTWRAYEPELTMDNYKKWFNALQNFVIERAPFFESIGIEAWEVGCGMCLFHNNGTGSDEDKKFFSQQTLDLMRTMKNNFAGKLLIFQTPWLLENQEILDSVSYINRGIYDIGWERITADNQGSLTVDIAKAAFLSDQLNPQNIANIATLGKTIVFDLTLQSRSSVFELPGYLEETGCTTSVGFENISRTNCLQRETDPDFSVQAIFFEAAYEALKSLNLTSQAIVMPMDYWETDSMISIHVFPALGATIRNKPAEGITKAWFAN